MLLLYLQLCIIFHKVHLEINHTIQNLGENRKKQISVMKGRGMTRNRINFKNIKLGLSVALFVVVVTLNSVACGATPLTVTIADPISDSIVLENNEISVTAEVSDSSQISKVIFYEYAKPGKQSKTIGEASSYPYTITYTPTYYHNGNGYSSNHILAQAITADNKTIMSSYARFYVFLPDTQKPTSQIAIAVWKDNKQAAYTPTYDDNYLIESQKIINTLHKKNITTNQERDIKGTLFWDTNMADWSELKRAILSENYLGMGAHTITHYDADTTPLDTMEFELKGAQVVMEKKIDKIPLTHAYPYYKVNDAVIDLTKKYYISARWGSNDGNTLSGEKTNPNDPAIGINAYNTTDYYKIKAMCPDTATPASTFNKWLDDAIAQRGWLVTSMHGLRSMHPNSWKCQEEAELNAHYDYVKTKINDGSVWNDTYENVALYLRERNSAMLTDKSSSNLFQYKYELTVNDTELSENLRQYLTYPLTITFKLPDGWYGVKVQQGDHAISAKLIAINGEMHAMFDIVPGQGEFVISRVND